MDFVAIVIFKTDYHGELFNISHSGRTMFDHFEDGNHEVGTIVRYELKDRRWAVNREEIENKFTGKISRGNIVVQDFRQEVAFRTEDLPVALQNQTAEGQLVSFSVRYDDNARKAFATDICAV